MLYYYDEIHYLVPTFCHIPHIGFYFACRISIVSHFRYSSASLIISRLQETLFRYSVCSF
jgi:hypothetical protein